MGLHEVKETLCVESCDHAEDTELIYLGGEVIGRPPVSF